MNPKVTTPLDDVPVISLADCQSHLRILPDNDSPTALSDDDLILAYLAAAREWVEGYTGLALTPRTLELALDAFPSAEIRLPVAPTISVVSISYVDGNGDTQAVPPEDYVVDTFQSPGWVMPAFGADWPEALDVANAVSILYDVGYTLWSTPTQTTPLPKSLRIAVLLLLGHLYENREGSIEASLNEIPLGIKSFCDWHRVRLGMA